MSIPSSNLPQSHRRCGSLLQTLRQVVTPPSLGGILKGPDRRRGYRMDSRGVDDNSILLGGNMEDASLRPSEQETNPLDVFGIRITSEASASRASLASSVPMLPIIDAPGEFEWFDYSKCDRLDIGDGEEHNYSLSLSSGSVTNTLDTSMNDVLLEEVRSLTGGSQCDPLIPIVNGGEIEETMIEIGAPKISIGEQASTCSGVLDNATRTVPRSPAHDAYMCKSHSITSIPSIVIIDATPRQQFDFKDEAIRPPCVPESQRYPHNQIHSKPIPWINGYTPDGGHHTGTPISRTSTAQMRYYDRASVAHPEATEHIYVGPDEHPSGSSRLSFLLRAIGARIRT